MAIRRVATLKTSELFRTYLTDLDISIPFDETVSSGKDAPLARSYTKHGYKIGNRFAILPMEGWDGTHDGCPTDLVRRRWTRFGMSGAKLIWGGEATAVRPDGRANPKQLMILDSTVGEIAELRTQLVKSHEAHFDTSDDLLVGLQLTHSGRFCRPKAGLEPIILYNHPILNKKFGLTDDAPLMTDSEIDELIDQFVHAAVLAQKAGFDFVDIKHCHGYLGHEFLSAIDREGKYGGSFENRTRFLRQITAGIRAEAPGLDIGVRLSAIDMVPFRPSEDGTGEPEPTTNEYPYAFGGDQTGLAFDLSEPFAFLDLLQSLDINLVCITAGSPYYNPHLIRPATFPPSDGYQPPEDPLVGVARHINITAQLKRHYPDLLMVGSGYSYLQDWLPNVAQNVVANDMVDFVGLGRMVLSYPDLPADVLTGNTLQRRYICRTFSDCTTAPRNNIVSGCYPLDAFYKKSPEFKQLVDVKKANRK